MISFTAGVWWLQQQPVLPDLKKLLMLISILVLIFFFLKAAFLGSNDLLDSLNKRFNNKYSLDLYFLLKHILILMFMLLLGMTWATWRAQLRIQDRLLISEENKTHYIKGAIIDLPIPLAAGLNGKSGWRFLFEPESCRQLSSASNIDTQASFNDKPLEQNHYSKIMQPLCMPYPQRLLLNWYGEMRSLQAGQHWHLSVVLKRPHGLSNPNGNDYEAWLFQQGIGATGSVRHGIYLHDKRDFCHTIDHWRMILLQHIRAILSANAAHFGIIQALTIGEQYAVTEEDWKRFRYTGTSHLLAISGLHITLVAAFIAFLSGWCWRRSRILMLWIPAPTMGLLIGFLGASLYGLVSGLHIPAQRALIMLMIFVLAQLSGRLTSPFVTLSWALFIVLLFDPWAVLSPGFWLSFSAVAAILLVLKRQQGYKKLSLQVTHKNISTYWQCIRNKLSQANRIQLAVTAMLIPLTALFFSQISLVTPLANAIAIPIFSFFVVPLILLGMISPVWLAKWFFSWAHQLLVLIAYFLDWLIAWPYAMLTIPSPPVWVLIMSLLGVLWFLCAQRWRMSGLILLLPLLWRPTLIVPRIGEFYAAILDVGQGGAVFIQTAHHTLLFDSGPVYFSGTDAAARVILPYLRKRGVTSLDKLIISHQDKDHSGGMHTLLQHLSIRELRSSIPEHHPLLHKKVISSVPHIPCHTGQSWEWDGVYFRILHPVSGMHGKSNALSCTLHITTTHHALLLPGDIEQAQEQSILTRIAPETIKATVLVIPHHGSKTSSSAEWLDAVQPEIAVAQVGYLNRFKHPRHEVLASYVQRAIKVLRSDYHGAVELLTDGSKIEWHSWREQYRRYWHWSISKP